MLSGDGRLARKLNQFLRLSNSEMSCLADLELPATEYPRGTQIVRQGDPGKVGYILQDGWGCCSKILQDGGRQVITFPIPGDVVGLRNVLLRTADHSFTALTNVTVSRVEIPRILKVFHEFPHLGSAILWAQSRDEAITVEHLASVGRRTAIERTAHFFLELRERLQMVGLATETEFECPLSQYELADALGLSSIHVNRVLRELREINLMTFHNRWVVLQDLAAIKIFAGYESVEEPIVLIRPDTNN